MNGPTMFCGNYDRGISLTVANINDAFSGVSGVRGRLAAKCRAVAPRAVHYLGQADGAILYDRLPAAYARYCTNLYGFEATTFAPQSVKAEPLSIMDDILGDEELIREIREIGRTRGWTISPFIQHGAVHELGRRTGLAVAGMTEDHIREERVVHLNDKELFQTACHRLGIATTPAELVKSWGELLKATQRQYERSRAVMLRQARGAGGLGNLAVTWEELERLHLKDRPHEYVEMQLLGQPGWTTDTILVEPLYRDVVCSPAVLCYIATDGGVTLVAESVQILKDHAFLGSVIPSGLETPIVERIVADTMKYAAWAAFQGARGYINVDWILRGGGELIACESNYRYTAVVHPYKIRRRLCGDDSPRTITWSNDALHVPEGLDFGKVLDHLDNHSIAWDPARQEGVIVTIPPALGSMGFVVLAKNGDRAREMSDIMAELEPAHTEEKN